MMTEMNKCVLADGRWKGAFGIGRFSSEILARLQNSNILHEGPSPLSLKSLAWLPYYLEKNKGKYKAFFSPGFNPILHSPIPFIFTLCDLIHLKFPGKYGFAKKIYYHSFIKSAAKRAYKIMTLSRFSKNEILNWLNIPEENVVIASCGISHIFMPEGEKHSPPYPYFLHVGNTKSHKNIERLLMAFAHSKIDSGIKIILTGESHPSISNLIKHSKISHRVIFSGPLSEEKLAEYYRGALGILFPSLYEGFGLPVLEGMASGVPVLTSTESSLPEVAGDAALMINPYQIDALIEGIEQLTHNTSLRQDLIQKGLLQKERFSWDKTAAVVQNTLDTI